MFQREKILLVSTKLFMLYLSMYVLFLSEASKYFYLGLDGPVKKFNFPRIILVEKYSWIFLNKVTI
jgi:hypothetical protein